MTKLYALFITLTAIRFLVMPVLAALAWISGSRAARQKIEQNLDNAGLHAPAVADATTLTTSRSPA